MSLVKTLLHEAFHVNFVYKKQELGATELARQLSGLTVNGGRLLFIERNGHF